MFFLVLIPAGLEVKLFLRRSFEHIQNTSADKLFLCSSHCQRTTHLLCFSLTVESQFHDFFFFFFFTAACKANWPSLDNKDHSDPWYDWPAGNHVSHQDLHLIPDTHTPPPDSSWPPPDLLSSSWPPPDSSCSGLISWPQRSNVTSVQMKWKFWLVSVLGGGGWSEQTLLHLHSYSEQVSLKDW